MRMPRGIIGRVIQHLDFQVVVMVLFLFDGENQKREDKHRRDEKDGGENGDDDRAELAKAVIPRLFGCSNGTQEGGR